MRIPNFNLRSEHGYALHPDPCVRQSGTRCRSCLLCVAHVVSVYLAVSGAQVPNRTFPVPDVAVVSTHRAPPNDVFGLRVEINFNHTGARLSPRMAAALNPVLLRDDQFWTRRHRDDRGEEFRHTARGASLWRNASFLVQEMVQVSNPRIAQCQLSCP